MLSRSPTKPKDKKSPKKTKAGAKHDLAESVDEPGIGTQTLAKNNKKSKSTNFPPGPYAVIRYFNYRKEVTIELVSIHDLYEDARDAAESGAWSAASERSDYRYLRVSQLFDKSLPSDYMIKEYVHVMIRRMV